MQDQIKSYKYNELTSKDFEELASISRAAFAEHGQRGINFRDTTITASEIAKSLAQENDTVFIFYIDGKTAGYTRGRLSRHKGKLVAYNDGIAVLPEHRGKQIGRLLNQEFHEWAKQGGALYATLSTSCRAQRIVAYHHSQGYKDWFYAYIAGKTYISVFMRKDFGKPSSRISRLLLLYTSWCVIHAMYTKYGQERILAKPLGYLLMKLRHLRTRLNANTNNS